MQRHAACEKTERTRVAGRLRPLHAALVFAFGPEVHDRGRLGAELIETEGAGGSDATAAQYIEAPGSPWPKTIRIQD